MPVTTALNLVLMVVPRAVTAEMITTALARIKRRREPLFRGREVAEGAAAPLRPVVAAHRSDSEDRR